MQVALRRRRVLVSGQLLNRAPARRASPDANAWRSMCSPLLNTPAFCAARLTRPCTRPSVSGNPRPDTAPTARAPGHQQPVYFENRGRMNLTTQRCLVGLCLSGIVTLVATAVSRSESTVARAQGESERVLVDDPRPLRAAILQFERRCHCVVTYEDPKWSKDEVEDLPGYPPGSQTPKVPKGHAFVLFLSRDPSAFRTSDQIEGALREMINAYDHVNMPGRFDLRTNGEVAHVLPKNNLLNERVTLERGTRSLLETVQIIVNGASQAKGESIKFGTIPINLMKKPITLGPLNERAGDVLATALAMSGRKLSWTLLYDYGYQAFYLNIHAVE